MSGHVLLAESVQQYIRVRALRAHPNETGGILLGVRSGRRTWIARAVELPDSHAGPTHYTVPPGSTKPAVLAARHDDQRLGYLGEWHVHPADQGASLIDRHVARSLTRRLRLTSITLIVARRTGSSYALEVLDARWNGIRTTSVVLTGDLPRASS